MSNRLGYVNDAVVGLTPGDDIESGMISGNYTYDEIGQLLSDAQEEIEEIKWTVKNKVHKVIRTSSSGKADLEFVYDAMPARLLQAGGGNRVCKIVKPDGSSVENGGTDQPTNWNYTYYNLDAQGNTLTVYEVDATNDDLMLTEQYIYGSERVGVLNRNVDMSGSLDTSNIYNHTLGKKAFELKNHLGNVLVTVSDMPFAMDDSGSDNITDAFEPQIMTVQDYTPFGMLMDGRQTSATDSKYGFNGQLKVDEITGIPGTHNTALYWEYDTRLGRRWNIDPVVKTDESPYTCFNDNPILIKDEKGDDGTTALAIEIATQEVAAAAGASVVFAPLVPVIELVGSTWALIEWIGEPIAIPTTIPQAKPSTLPKSKSIPATKGKASTSTSVWDRLESKPGIMPIEKPGPYVPKEADGTNRKIEKDKRTGKPKIDEEVEGPHTQMGEKDGENGSYPKRVTIDKDGKVRKEIDHTDHGRTNDPGHKNPHEHYYPKNTHGDRTRGAARPLFK